MNIVSPRNFKYEVIRRRRFSNGWKSMCKDVNTKAVIGNWKEASC